MKNFKLVPVFFLFLLIFVSVSAEQPLHFETVTFKVSGNCQQCKERIEKVVTKSGVLKANWDLETKMLTITFNPHILRLEDIHQWLAEAGHDTEKVTAENEVYKNTSVCCKYRNDNISPKKEKSKKPE